MKTNAALKSKRYANLPKYLLIISIIQILLFSISSCKKDNDEGSNDGGGGVSGASLYTAVYGAKPTLYSFYAPSSLTWGYIDKRGSIVIPPSFEYAEPFYNKIAVVGKEEQEMEDGEPTGNSTTKYSLINETGKDIGYQFYQTGYFSNSNLINVCNKEGKWGFVDQEGNLNINYQYPAVYEFHNGLCAVQGTSNGEFGIIDNSGTLVLSYQYQDVGPYCNGIMFIKKGGKWGAVDRDGKLKIANIYSSVYTIFMSGKAAVQFPGNNKWGYIDGGGNTVIQPNYEEANAFSEGLAGVKTGGKWGFIKTDGKYAINPIYNEVSFFSEGLVPVKAENGLWGYLNNTGKEIIPFQFRDADIFLNGVALVKLDDNKYAYINTSGNNIYDFSIGTSGKSISSSETATPQITFYKNILK